MKIDDLLTLYEYNPIQKQFAEALKENLNPQIQLKGLCGSSLTLIASSLIKKIGGTHLFILNDKEEAAYFFNDLENILESKNLFFFPASYKTHYEGEKTDNANILFRAEALDGISKSKKFNLIITYPEALTEKVVTQKHLKSHTLQVATGDKLSLDFINELLFEYEFHRVDFVSEPGEFAIRGGIVDIFSYSNDHPYRIEFFGDEVESIRSFNVSTQLSVQKMAKIHIVPNVQDKLLKESRSSFFEFLPSNTNYWTKDAQLTAEKLDIEFEKFEEKYHRIKNNTIELEPAEVFIRGIDFIKALERSAHIQWGQTEIVGAQVLHYKQSPQPFFKKNFELLVENLEKNTAGKIQNVIVSNNPKQLERLYRIFEDIGKEVQFTTLVANFNEGFIDYDHKLAFFTDHQIFERYHRYRLKDGFQKSKQNITIKELMQLNKGDFVSHVDHGVGRFDGLEKIDVNGKEQEAIRLIYKDNDILYVSIHSLHRISKFTGKEGVAPKINKLGSPAWNALKQKTKKNVKKIAFDLISLYAARKAKKGTAYSPDSYLQHELESSFIYEDTPDQITATADVKKDLESLTPMDRLICGDVGFGKTEIAVRAAFKVACEGKQVAILVPTTILATQHFKTFQERLKEFPVRVDYVNRFRSTKDQKAILKDLAEGRIDIIIGTHRIAGKDVKFKDLGLLIIDEEQKFGVGVKDKLKTMRVDVDSLTLTATPIPRTLQFSLMKARDLSVITTPPPNRYPVQTEIKPFGEEVIRDAIYYEVSRNGQVFFVHNRVQNIKEVTGLIQKLVPEVKVRYAHGQMSGEELEEVMLAFIDNEFDVLVATTIIESGIDISNANTIIINQAQNFGLSDLHQMRGRVGRSNKKAFCYLLAPPLSSVSSEARKRLQAIEQFAELGSGFNIAMRDLDIRGAGNLLGGEQSGFMSEIGFDMYQKILDEAIDELKHNEFKELFAEEIAAEKEHYISETQLDIDLELLIPDTYVNQITERLSLYKQLSEIKTEEELLTFEKELTDRFGPVPRSCISLMNSMRLKWQAEQIGFEKLVLKNNHLLCYFIFDQQSDYFQSPKFQQVLAFLQANPRKGTIKEKNKKLFINFSGIYSVENALVLLHEIMQYQPLSIS